MTALADTTRFLIDFNAHDVAVALGVPIPQAAAALIYGVPEDDIASYQAEIDAGLARAVAACSEHPGLAALRHALAPSGGPLLCIGDSITTYRYSYAHLLRHALAPDGIPVLNHGYSGHTSTHGLELTFTRFLHLQPALVTIKYGVNDCKQFGGPEAPELVSPTDYARNLRQIVRAFQQHTSARVVVLTPTPVCEAIVNPLPDIRSMRLIWRNQRLLHYAELALEAAAETGALAVDLRQALGSPPDSALYCPDGLHPNAAGQWMIFEQMLAAFASESPTERTGP